MKTSKTYTEAKARWTQMIQQDLVTVTEIRAFFDIAYEMGHEEGAYDALKDTPVSEPSPIVKINQRYSDISKFVRKYRHMSDTSLYVKCGPSTGVDNLYIRQHDMGGIDYTELMRGLTTEEIDYCINQGIKIK